MVATKTIASLTGLLAMLAVASPLISKRDGFSIQQVGSGHAKKPGPVAYKAALEKYGAHVPTRVINAAQAAQAQSGSVYATPAANDEQYLCPVDISGQTLYLDFDTGSADLWVFSSETPSNEVAGQKVWDVSGGTLMSGESWSITYGDGSGASGNVYQAQVVVGGVTATSQAVEAATSVSSSFASNAADDGLLGLAFSSINTVTPNQQTTFFDTVKSTLASPIFAVTLKHGTPGTYDFGYIDSSKYTGSITYVPVDSSQGFWGFTADGTSVTSSSLSCIADTGTTLILIDDSVVSGYYGQVSGAQNSASAGGWIFDCNASLPNFSVTIGGNSFTVPGSYINYAANGDGTCFGGIQSSSGVGINILGDVFLKAQYVVFDSGNNQIGFAAQA